MTEKSAHIRAVSSLNSSLSSNSSSNSSSNDDYRASRDEDVALAKAVVSGDPSAEQQLATRVFDVTLSTVSYALRFQSSVDDVVQDALIEILKSMKNFRGECSLETWARKIAVRIVYHRIRKKRRREALQFWIPAVDDTVTTAEDLVSEKELGIHLNLLVRRLPEKQQVAVQLRFIHELPLREISQIVEAPEETVRHRIKTGKKNLKKMIADNPAFVGWLEKGIG